MNLSERTQICRPGKSCNLRMFQILELTILCLSWSFVRSLTCLDPNNNEVDWYSVYKSPKIHKNSDWKIRAGLAHYYLDVHSPQWAQSDLPINSSDQQVSYTLQQIYKPKSNKMMYIMYNDESPDSMLRSRGGHTKGVVAFDGTSGFWLVHSTPKFPPKQSEGYDWPSSAEDYGQAFLCVSLPLKELGTVATQLQFNQPDIYDHNVPAEFLDNFPVLQQVISGKPPSGPPWSSVLSLTSINQQTFLSFAKSSKFEADLYDALVAPYLQRNLLVETWLRNPGTPLLSNCSAKYKVLKIEEIRLPINVVFEETKDHSKWAVTTPKGQMEANLMGNDQFVFQMASSSSDYACVGDINRMDSQFHRGGGTLCIPHPGVWKAFTDAIANYQSCV